MRRVMFVLLAVMLMLTACSKEKDEPVEPGKITSVETKELSDGSFVSTLNIADHRIFVYKPADEVNSNIINYGYSAPLLLVFGEGKMDQNRAVAFICEKGIDRVARDNGGSVVFVNPATDWKSEKKGLYEAVLAKTMVDQTGFSKGLLYDRANREYFIFASPAMTCLYGYGPGGDYIAKYCLRELTGQSAMKSLGIDDITITAAVLEKLSFEASVNDRNIIIVSKDNDQSIENAMMARTDNCFSDNGSFDEIFYKYIDGYQRWNGRLSETFNRKKIGLTVSTHVFDIPTSPDNTSVRSSFHKIGAVVFHKDNGKGKKPLLLCFHGGGDTALATATIAGWPQIAREEDFILCATEMHTLQTATEVMDVLEEIKKLYDIDETRIYATGFSMGGIKTWDLYQEYPDVFAAMAPMGATVAPGKNTMFRNSPTLNEDVLVPLMYCGGESSPLGELPYQSRDCVSRINYLFDVNRISKPFELSMANRSDWTDTKYGFAGDVVEQYNDETHPDSVTTIRYYYSEDGNIYTALCSISRHAHEIRPFTFRLAWDFMKKYSRNSDGRIVINQ